MGNLVIVLEVCYDEIDVGLTGLINGSEIGATIAGVQLAKV